MKNNGLLPFLFCAIGLLAAFNAIATVVTFGFNGTVTSLQNPSNDLRANITYGTPFNGIVTCDTSAILGGVDYDFSTNSGAYYFSVNGGLWLSVSMAGHSFDTTTSMAGDSYAAIIIYNFATPQDVFWVDASAPTIRIDGATFPGTPATSGFSFTLYDKSGTAYTIDPLPLTSPDLSAFPNLHQLAISG